ncbi:MAG: DNA cytosine methyltransferase [Nitrospirae bacterium]|nr:DNA cytosine methyltransferase [Nitrospirota bacterium]
MGLAYWWGMFFNSHNGRIMGQRGRSAQSHECRKLKAMREAKEWKRLEGDAPDYPPKFKLLDLFCCAGGASMGYHRAGFDVTGVDIEPQPHYPFAFVQSDALDYLSTHGHIFDAVHTSPPCQAYSIANQQWRKAGKDYPDMVEPTRQALKANGKPYIIENVPGAPLINPIVLNGGIFSLKVRRVRLFECSFYLPFILLPNDAPSTFRMGRPIKEGDAITPVGHFSNVPYARKEMRIDWMTRAELTQAIPPPYTEWIGKQLMNHLKDNQLLDTFPIIPEIFRSVQINKKNLLTQLSNTLAEFHGLARG